MMTTNSTGVDRDTRPPEPDLDRRYGRIAISALLAALPYGGESKIATPASPNPASRTPHKDRAA